MLPPPIGSKPSIAVVWLIASISWPLKSGSVESSTWVAPRSSSSLTCAWLRTMLTNGTPSSWQTLTSICPRFEAAAAWTSPVKPSILIVSTNPNAVIGLTKLEAPCSVLTSSGSGRVISASA